LIHAGDLTNQGSLSELQKTVSWLEEADFEAKIVIAGNHDITLDDSFYREHGASWRFPQPQDPESCLMVLTKSPSITYLQHQSTTFHLQSPTGPHTRFKVFGSPYSPVIGKWAFQYAEADATRHWEAIPLDTDIVITHTPPRNHCDAGGKGHSLGCEALRRALWLIRPRLVICGHIHEGRGAERVTWRLDGQEAFAEEGTEHWSDPGAGSNRQSLVDLTVKGRTPLANDGAATCHDMAHLALQSTEQSESGGQPDGVDSMRFEGSLEKAGLELQAVELDTDRGGLRRGRKETCVVNAAIMAAGWGDSPKQFNKPIVVDVDLPVWTEGEALLSKVE